MKILLFIVLITLTSCSSEKKNSTSLIIPVASEAELLQKEMQRQESIHDRAISEANKNHNPILICKEEGVDTRYIFSRNSDGSLRTLLFNEKSSTQRLSEIAYVCKRYTGAMASVVSFPISFLETDSDNLYSSNTEDCRYGDITRGVDGPIIGHSGKKSEWSIEFDGDNSKAKILSKDAYYKVINQKEKITSIQASEINLYNCTNI